MKKYKKLMIVVGGCCLQAKNVLGQLTVHVRVLWYSMRRGGSGVSVGGDYFFFCFSFVSSLIRKKFNQKN